MGIEQGTEIIRSGYHYMHLNGLQLLDALFFLLRKASFELV